MKIADVRAFPLRISTSEEALRAGGDYHVNHSRSITIYSSLSRDHRYQD